MPYIGDDYSMPRLNKNRRGSFRIAEKMLESSPDLVQMIMSKVIVVRCEFDYSTRSFEYIAFCDLFEEIPDSVRELHYGFIAFHIINPLVFLA